MGSRKIFTPQEFEQLADRTLEHYRENAEDFREGTRDHDVSQHYYRPPELPRAQQPWLATLWRRSRDARDANNAS